MGFFSQLRNRKQTDIAGAVVNNASVSDEENVEVVAADNKEKSAGDDSSSDLESEVSKDALPGIQKMEGASLVWTKKSLYITYAWIWVCFFMLALQETVGINLIAYAYADFSAAPLLSTASILASIIGGVVKLPIAKVLNIWGRAEGFLFFLVIYLLGIIILAACNGPSSYAAGYVLYWIGYDALYLILDVFVADACGLKNRAFAFGFVSTPFICTAFVGPLAVSSILENATWRWGYGIFAIVMPFVFLPLAVFFKYYQIKAEKLGVLKKEPSGRTSVQSFVHYFHEFDIVGCFLLMAAFVLTLLPFSLASYGRAQYKSAQFIAMVIIGLLLFPVFALWEKFFARTHFVKWEYFTNRTIVGACVLAFTLYINFYCWDLYYYSFVMVVYNLSATDGNYMSQIYNIGSCFAGPVFGIYVRLTRHFKFAALFFGLPLMFLGSGLMIYFRGSDHSIGYVVMCQIFIAFAGGILVVSEDMAAMASAAQSEVAMMLSLLGLSASVGGAIGYAICAAIYDNTFYKFLVDNLPTEYVSEASAIYLGGITTQMTSYAVGTEARNVINGAWGESQKYNCIASTCILVIAIPAIAVWKNYDVSKTKKIKGTSI